MLAKHGIRCSIDAGMNEMSSDELRLHVNASSSALG